LLFTILVAGAAARAAGVAATAAARSYAADRTAAAAAMAEAAEPATAAFEAAGGAASVAAVAGIAASIANRNVFLDATVGLAATLAGFTAWFAASHASRGLVRNHDLLAHGHIDRLANRNALDVGHGNRAGFRHTLVGADLVANRDAFLHELRAADRHAFRALVDAELLDGFRARSTAGVAAGIAGIAAAAAAVAEQGRNFTAFPVGAVVSLGDHFGALDALPLGDVVNSFFVARNLFRDRAALVDGFAHSLILGHLLGTAFRHRLTAISCVALGLGDGFVHGTCVRVRLIVAFPDLDFAGRGTARGGAAARPCGRDSGGAACYGRSDRLRLFVLG